MRSEFVRKFHTYLANYEFGSTSILKNSRFSDIVNFVNIPSEQFIMVELNFNWILSATIGRHSNTKIFNNLP